MWINLRHCSIVWRPTYFAVPILMYRGNMLLAATYENTVNIWDLRSHDYVRSLVGHSGYSLLSIYRSTFLTFLGAVYSVALSGSDNNKLMSGSYDNTIRVWDLRTMKALQRATSHSSSVEALVSKDDKVYSGSSDQTIKIWRMPGMTNSVECHFVVWPFQEVARICESGIQFLCARSIERLLIRRAISCQFDTAPCYWLSYCFLFSTNSRVSTPTWELVKGLELWFSIFERKGRKP